MFLEDSNVIVRTEAARCLMHRPSRKVFLHVAKLLTSKTVYKREVAAFTLQELGTPKRPYKKEIDEGVVASAEKRAEFDRARNDYSSIAAVES